LLAWRGAAGMHFEKDLYSHVIKYKSARSRYISEGNEMCKNYISIPVSLSQLI